MKNIRFSTAPTKPLLRLWKGMGLWQWCWVFLAMLLLSGYYFCLPDPLFKTPVSTVLEDREGNLLGARIAADEQWRFPYSDTVPDQFARAIICFEDKRFYRHPGVDPIAFLRAMWINLRQGKIISGGSTLSMQVIRLSRKNRSRTIWEKLIEIVLATRLEIRHTKSEILALYASQAPFGGNVVGLSAASWKYYGRSPEHLSWSESATLAVLPNSPALIHPGKNRQMLRQKRNKLLERLYQRGQIDSITCVLAKTEPLPDKPIPLPSYAPHLLDKVQAAASRQPSISRLRSTLEVNLQNQVNRVIHRHYLRLSENGIHNAGAMVVDAGTGDVLAYVGNVPGNQRMNGSAVNMITAHRSSGSIFKPFLYAGMLDAGELLPHTLVADIPTYFGSYTPKNFDLTYDGALPASEALYRSLNVPAVRMLNRYGVQRFHDLMMQIGATTLTKPASHYGLSLILGGAEASLWDLAAMYSGMVRQLKFYRTNQGKYDRHAFRPLNYRLDHSRKNATDDKNLIWDTPLSASAIWNTFESLIEVKRPGVEGYWRKFSSKGKVAWKTGTSFGFRDAWAVGCTPDYVVAVWCGNADGEGRPGLTGLKAAAPVLFDIFDLLDQESGWFEQPYDDMVEIAVCHKSGHRALPICAEVDTVLALESGRRTRPCPYHKMIHLDPAEQYQVHSECASPMDMVHRSFFILPPAQEGFYKRKHPDYTSLPPYRNDCAVIARQSNPAMELIYPKRSSLIAIPVNLDETSSSTVFEVAHRRTEAVIYWHLDDKFLGTTKHIHEWALNPVPGQHSLTLVDESGEILRRQFEVF